jgi:uncharacterized spore protein YtfJ
MSNKNEKDNIDKLIDKTFDHIKDIVDANIVIGDIVELGNGIYVVPVSKISVGLVSGGGTNPNIKNKNLLLGSTTGFNIVPVGFITINQSAINFLAVNSIDDFSKNVLDGIFKIYSKMTENEEVNDEEE